MWPFTARRIFSNRWWALAFAVVVVWQAAEFAGSTPSTGAAGAPIEEQGLRDAGNALDAM